MSRVFLKNINTADSNRENLTNMLSSLNCFTIGKITKLLEETTEDKKHLNKVIQVQVGYKTQDFYNIYDQKILYCNAISFGGYTQRYNVGDKVAVAFTDKPQQTYLTDNIVNIYDKNSSSNSHSMVNGLILFPITTYKVDYNNIISLHNEDDTSKLEMLRTYDTNKNPKELLKETITIQNKTTQSFIFDKTIQEKEGKKQIIGETFDFVNAGTKISSKSDTEKKTQDYSFTNGKTTLTSSNDEENKKYNYSFTHAGTNIKSEYDEENKTQNYSFTNGKTKIENKNDDNNKTYNFTLENGKTKIESKNDDNAGDNSLTITQGSTTININKDGDIIINANGKVKVSNSAGGDLKTILDTINSKIMAMATGIDSSLATNDGAGSTGPSWVVAPQASSNYGDQSGDISKLLK